MIGPSEKDKFIPKEWGGQKPSQSKCWELPMHQAPVQGSLSGTGDLWVEIHATGELILHCETLLVHNLKKNIRLPADLRLSFTAVGPERHLKIPLMSEHPSSLYPSTWRLGELRNVFTAEHREFSWKQFMPWNLLGVNPQK